MNKIAQIEKILGVKPDGIWDAKDQAALSALKGGSKTPTKSMPRVPMSNLTDSAGPPPGGGFAPSPGLMQ